LKSGPVGCDSDLLAMDDVTQLTITLRMTQITGEFLKDLYFWTTITRITRLTFFVAPFNALLMSQQELFHSFTEYCYIHRFFLVVIHPQSFQEKHLNMP
jgi:hypothetical protein